MEENLKLSVSELTQMLKQTLEASFFGLTVEGEISNFNASSSGHWYFNLKDKDSMISATMWKNSVMRLGFIPKNGDKVTVTGSISVYPPRGTYQINCVTMRLSGEGDILAMLEERKRRYAAMGWFEGKKPIPARPEKVAVITSSTGAALHDILQVTGRRNAGLDIIILPAQVQGDDAARQIAARIEEVNMFALAPVMIVGRGGGSLEDLLPFSDDLVIKAIHESEVPVISAVGHEVDWAISDFVADLRAPTPSAAAELVCGSGMEQLEKVNSIKNSMFEIVRGKLAAIRSTLSGVGTSASERIITGRIGNARYAMDSQKKELEAALKTIVTDRRHSLEVKKNTFGVVPGRLAAVRRELAGVGTHASERIVSERIGNARNAMHYQVRELGVAVKTIISDRKHSLNVRKNILEVVNPGAVLERGYAIVSSSDGKTVRNSSDLKKGDDIRIRLGRGKVGAQVTEVEK